MLNFTSLASSSAGNTNILTDGHTKILLDCGLPWKKIKQLMNFKTSSLAGILITHSHGDHCKGVMDANKAIDIYMLPETKSAVCSNGFGHRLHAIDLLETFAVGTFKIKAFPLIHDVPSCGYLISNSAGEKMVYIIDTAYCAFRFPALHTIAIECNYQEYILNANVESGSIPYVMKKRIMRSHFSLRNVLDFLKANDLSKLEAVYLLHLSNNNSNEVEMKKAVQEVTGKPVYVCA